MQDGAGASEPADSAGYLVSREGGFATEGSLPEVGVVRQWVSENYPRIARGVVLGSWYDRDGDRYHLDLNDFSVPEYGIAKRIVTCYSRIHSANREAFNPTWLKLVRTSGDGFEGVAEVVG